MQAQAAVEEAAVGEVAVRKGEKLEILSAPTAEVAMAGVQA
jgi:hypothetical protein